MAPAPPQIHEIHSLPGRALAAMQGIDRDARAPRLHEVVHNCVEVYREIDLCVVGCGSVGSYHADKAARLAPRTLLLVDPAKLKQTSVLTHPCQPSDIGRSKAQVAGERAKAVSPGTRVFVFEGGIEDVPSNVLADVSHTLLASDNLRAETIAGARALQLDFELLQGSLYAPTLTAQCRVFPVTKDAAGACPACGMGEAELQALDEGTVFSCTGDGAVRHAGRPTVSLPYLCSLAADLTLNELTRSLVGLADGEGSRLIEFSGFTRKTSVTTLSRRLDCPYGHAPTRLVEVADLGSVSVAEYLAEAGYGSADARRVSVRVEGYEFVSLVTCGCARHDVLLQFVRDGSSGGVCSGCGEVRAAHPFHAHRETPVSVLEDRVDWPLSALGAESAASLRVRSEHGSVVFYRPSVLKGETS